MRYSKLIPVASYLAVVIGIGVGGYLSRGYWLPLINRTLAESGDTIHSEPEPSTDGPEVLKLSKQARANLGLVSAPAIIQSYWRKLQIPGIIVDRSGLTDQGVTSPIAGVVVQVHALEGDIVQPGDRIFTIRLVSEYLQKTQAELFKAIRETELLNREINRIDTLAKTGVIPEKRLIELDQELSRQAALIDAHRQDLLTRGLTASHVQQIETGKFISTIDVTVPADSQSRRDPQPPVKLTGTGTTEGHQTFFEVQELKVELGHQVEAGESLAMLANHRRLYIQGHAFKKESTHLEMAMQNGWSIDVEFTEDASQSWPEVEQQFQIRHLANVVDEQSRTFDFFIPLNNQSRIYQGDDRTTVVWRFRPGQRVRLLVPIEKMEGVMVLPTAAVVREGPEAYVFQQNGDLFRRLPVHIIYEDRLNIVIANDGSILPGVYLAQGSAESLNRVYKSQSASGETPGVHVHADGTVHSGSH